MIIDLKKGWKVGIVKWCSFHKRYELVDYFYKNATNSADGLNWVCRFAQETINRKNKFRKKGFKIYQIKDLFKLNN